MINSDFIIQYTNALYSTYTDSAPTYDEFRDMFSSGQIHSKEWLINELNKIHTTASSCIITGAWYGTLGMLLYDEKIFKNITMLDIDARCEKFVRNIIYDKPELKYITGDMYNHNYTEDIVINTSCEHIPNLKSWIKLIPKNKMLILQSNNFKGGIGHINCVDSIGEFLTQSGLQKIMYAGEFKTNIYTRYMIIGKTNGQE